MITVREMRELEERSGIPKIELMETAGRRVFEFMKEDYDLNGKKILIVCYHGNNGGDGFVAAHYLSDISEVDVLFLGDEEKLTHESRKNYERIIANTSIQVMSDYEFDFDDYDFIVDAILGTSTDRPLLEPICEIVDMINASKAVKIAIDIPTGLDPDTGEIPGTIVNPDVIITFHDTKPGLDRFKDKLKIADIGIR